MAAWAKAGTDIDGFMAFFDDDVRGELMVREDLMPKLRGPFDKAGWRAQALAESQVSPLVMTVDHAFGDLDNIAIEATGRLDVAGYAYENRYAFVGELAEGRIRRFRIYLDTLHAMEVVKHLQASDQPAAWKD